MVIDLECVLPLLARIDYLHLDARFQVVENLAADALLGTSFIYQCLHEILSIERKVVPRHSRPVAIATMNRASNLINDYATLFKENLHSHDDSNRWIWFCRLPVKQKYLHVRKWQKRTDSKALAPWRLRPRQHRWTPMFHDHTRSNGHFTCKAVLHIYRNYDGHTG